MSCICVFTRLRLVFSTDENHQSHTHVCIHVHVCASEQWMEVDEHASIEGRTHTTLPNNLHAESLDCCPWSWGLRSKMQVLDIPCSQPSLGSLPGPQLPAHTPLLPGGWWQPQSRLTQARETLLTTIPHWTPSPARLSHPFTRSSRGWDARCS